MPDKEEHLKIVRHNYNTLSHLSQPEPSKYTDWCTTIVYYMALHYIHAYLAKKDEHPTSHISLQPKMQAHPNLKSLYATYRNLEDDARDARYDGKKLEIYDMRNGTLRWFNVIQVHILNLLKIDIKNAFNLHTLFPKN